jgi:hypothetical protein
VQSGRNGAAQRGELPVNLIGRRLLVPRVALLRLLGDDQEAERAWLTCASRSAGAQHRPGHPLGRARAAGSSHQRSSSGRRSPADRVEPCHGLGGL